MRMFGLIGFPLSHSFSKKFFSEKFLAEGIVNCSYENFSIPSMEHFQQLIAQTPLEGLNVTIPYKQQVIPYLNYANDVVKKIGACNCIKFKNGKLYGYNTDAVGFERSLMKYLLPHHKKALILGTGGAAKAIKYVLKKLGIEYISLSRSNAEPDDQILRYEDVTEDLVTSHTLIINTTPLGMYPHVDTFPPINYDMLSPSHYLFDAVYNPEMTLFLRNGKQKGAAIQNGFDMLIIQAEESWKIWNSDIEEDNTNGTH